MIKSRYCFTFGFIRSFQTFLQIIDKEDMSPHLLSCLVLVLESKPKSKQILCLLLSVSLTETTNDGIISSRDLHIIHLPIC